jgi:flavin reductase (DIM6/NTAB) family NADH-FMN oxidoreductase RutF
MMSRILLLSDGTRARILEAGKGEPVLLVHGVGMRAEAWGPQVTALSADHHVIAVDMPGHGGSDLLADGAGLPDYVAWAARVVQALGLGPVSVAGHSMGALVAAGLAADHPDLVCRLAVLNAVQCRSPEARAAVLARAEEIARGEGDAEVPLARWFGDTTVDLAVRPKVAEWLRGVDARGYAAAYRAFAEGDRVHAGRWDEIRCPVLALTGGGDANSTPEMTRAIAKAAPRGEAVIVEGHRHMVNLTAPEAVTDALRHWLGRPRVESRTDPTQPRRLRDAFGTFMTGVTVVTAMDAQGNPLGFTANSFSSISLDPPLLMVSISRRSLNHGAFVAGRGFAVNILSEGQKDISATFARPVADRFADVRWRRGPEGSPLIAGTSAWFDCQLQQTVEAGDHTILIGKIAAFDAAQAAGLGYYRGNYFTPAETAVNLPTGPDVVISAVLERAGEVLLVDDGAGGLTLPVARVGREGVQAALEALIGQTGVPASPGFIYAVYEDVARGHQHIAFLCPAAEGKPRRGAFVDPARGDMSDVTDPAMRIMLERLGTESRMGNYGIYFGNQERGRVEPIRERTGP